MEVTAHKFTALGATRLTPDTQVTEGTQPDRACESAVRNPQSQI